MSQPSHFAAIRTNMVIRSLFACLCCQSRFLCRPFDSLSILESKETLDVRNSANHSRRKRKDGEADGRFDWPIWLVALRLADLLEELIVQCHVGCVGCAGLVDSAVCDGHVSGNSSIVFRDCGSVSAIGAVVATGRSISSVAAIGGQGFVGLLQGLLELLGLLVILSFCGVGFADGGGGVGGTAQRFRSGDFRLMKFGKLVEVVRLVKTGERFGDFCLQLERLRIGGVHGRDGFLAVVQRGQVTHLLRCAYTCESEDRTQNNDHDDYGDNDLAVEALYMLVRPSVTVADALRYGCVEQVLRLAGFAAKCSVGGRAVDCDTAGSGVSAVGRSVGRCASGKCSRCAWRGAFLAWLLAMPCHNPSRICLLFCTPR